ncbi:LytTR family DNA-binding domain-containing protein [Roseovarius sp. E0-M6]|uniref:LytTR family DNA-binding domain-containing protein n=1 Tax=Roseovarius sp. E0-M6 TaxID=3127118 RepID=UPI003010400F
MQDMTAPFTVFVWLCAVLLATISEPFHTDTVAAWPVRLGLWAVIISVVVLVTYLVRAVAGRFVPSRMVARFDLVSLILMTSILTPAVIVVWAAFRTFSSLEPLSFICALGGASLASVAIIGVRRLAPGLSPLDFVHDNDGAITLPESVMESDPSTPAVEDIQRAPTPRLMRRVEHLVGPVVRLTAQGHFVEVVTESGRHQLRLRLADAIAEMEPVEGLQVHRSHWVTRDAMDRFEPLNAHKAQLYLTNGDVIPVSRSYRKQVKTALEG